MASAAGSSGETPAGASASATEANAASSAGSGAGNETKVASAPAAEEPGTSTGEASQSPAPASSAGAETQASPEPTPPAAGATPEVASAEPAKPVDEKPSTPAPPKIVPEIAVTAVEADTAGALFVAGTANTPAPVRVYLDGAVIGEATPSPSGTWLLEIQREMPPATYDVRADQVDPATGEVIVRAEVPFEREIDVAVLSPVAEAGGPGGATASGAMPAPTTIIIKRRDNLWRLSRQMYGKGVRWSTIYEANRDQIRNPRWIFPGQVFVMPTSDTKWKQ